MANALWITLIGMGLVFLAIMLLWGLMALLVWATAEREEASPEEAEAMAEAVPAGDQERKRRAAAAAVSIALALRKPEGQHQSPAAQPSGGLSAWQAVHRAGQVSQRIRSSREKVVR